jgi:hypothetical protein
MCTEDLNERREVEEINRDESGRGREGGERR